MPLVAGRIKFHCTEYLLFPQAEEDTDSLINILRDSLNRNSDRELIVDLAASGQPERVCGAALWSGACRSAQWLADKGIAPGSRVALSGANSARWVAAALGARLAGCTLAPLDSELSQAERANILSFLEPHAVLTESRLRSHFENLAPHCLELDNIDLTPGAPGFEPLDLQPEQPWAIVFTSGSTGVPKGVLLSEANLLHQVRMLTGQPGLIGGKDRALNLLPLHHVYPFTAATLTPLAAGCPIVYPRSLRGEDIAAACREERISILIVVPQVLTALNRRILDQAAEQPLPVRLAFKALAALGGIGINRGLRPGKYLFRSVHSRFPSLRFAACGGARLEAETHRSLARLGFRIVEAYGLSETAPVVCLNSLERPVFGSVGQAAPGVSVRIERTDPALDEGEVLVKGPNVTAGYYRNPEATREAFTAEGWLRTGDLGRLDPHGNLFLTGRSKEVLVLPSGKNIYPEELEKVYERSPLVGEICLCLTGGRGEERLTAVVAPAREELARRRSTRVLEDIKFDLENLARALPSYQRVTRVLLYGEPFPRTRLGKLRRWEIAARLARENIEHETPGQASASGDELLEFVREYLKLDRPPRESDSLEVDLGLDSLSKLEFLSAFERRFGIRLSEQAAASVVSLRDLRPLVEDALTGISPGSGQGDNTGKPLDEIADPGRGITGWFLRAFARLTLRAFCRMMFRAEITGLEYLPASPYILAPNHVSYLDWVVLYAMLPPEVTKRLYSVGIADILDRFPLSALCYHGRVIKTGTLATTALSLEHSRQVLERGLPLCMFPEGKRSFDCRTDLPKRGLGLLTIRTGAKVVPVYIHGSRRSMSRLHPWLRPVKIRVEILPPLESGLDERETGRIWHKLMQERDPHD